MAPISSTASTVMALDALERTALKPSILTITAST